MKTKTIMEIHLFNGAKTKDAWNEDSPHFIDDWKPEEKTIKCDGVEVTYGQHLKVYLNSERIMNAFWHDDLIEHEGIFYGDFVVRPSVEEAEQFTGNTMKGLS